MDHLRELRGCIEGPKEAVVIVVGDVMLDRYVYGYANSLNSTAPVPVLVETERRADAGAAAHVARSLHDLGLATRLFAVVGDDDEGVELEESLGEAGVDTKDLAMVEGMLTSLKTRLIGRRKSLVSNQQMLLRWDRDNLDGLEAAVRDPIISSAIMAIPDADVLVISDYGNGLITDQSAVDLVEAANSAGIPVIFDPKLTGLDRSRGATAVIFQSRGMRLMQQRMAAESIDRLAQDMLEEHDWQAVFVIGGEDGVVLHRPEVESIVHPCRLDVSLQEIGLLDAAAAALGLTFAHGLDLEDGAELVNAACECVLQAEDSREFVLTKRGLITRLDEAAWQMQISQR